MLSSCEWHGAGASKVEEGSERVFEGLQKQINLILMHLWLFSLGDLGLPGQILRISPYPSLTLVWHHCLHLCCPIWGLGFGRRPRLAPDSRSEAPQSGYFRASLLSGTETRTWTTPEVTTPPPSPRTFHTSSAVIGNQLYVFGGGERGAQPVQDVKLHVLDASMDGRAPWGCHLADPPLTWCRKQRLENDILAECLTSFQTSSV